MTWDTSPFPPYTAAVPAAVAEKMPPRATAPAVENRVNGFDVFALPRIGVDVPFSPDCTVAFPLYLRQTASAKPYSYVMGNPLNGMDPGGLGWCGIKDQAQVCTTLPPSYAGPTKTCLMSGNGSSDQVTVEYATSCHALETAGSTAGEGATYTSIDLSGSGATPANQTCSFDPGTGLSHCTTSPSEVENEVFITGALLVPDVIMFLCGADEAVAGAYVAGEVAVDVYDWTRHSGRQ